MEGQRFSESWIISSGKKHGIRYDLFRAIPEVSRYSSLLPNHIAQAREIFEDIVAKSGRPIEVVIDATAHIGADSLVVLTGVGNRRETRLKIYPIERDPKTFEALVENCKNYSKIHPKGPRADFFPQLGSCLGLFRKLPRADLLYFDPPWGGTDYTKKNDLVLELGGVSVASIIRGYLRGSPSTIVVCKQPKNYNRLEFSSKLWKYHVDQYPVKKGKDEISYYLVAVFGDLDPFASIREVPDSFRIFANKMTKNPEALLHILGDRSLTFGEKLYAARKLIPDSERKHVEGKGRADSRVTEYMRLFRPLPNQSVAYLDVGCSEGTITNEMAVALKAKIAKACDIDPQAGKKLNKSIEFAISTPTTLPYPSKSFDVVTLTMVAHHFSEGGDGAEEAMLQEVARVSRGQVLVREHDTENTGPFRDFLDSIHALYSCVFGDEMTVKGFINTYHHSDYAHYRTVEEWKTLFERAGLELRSTISKDDYVRSVVMAFEVWSPPFRIAKAEMETLAFTNIVATPLQLATFFSVNTPFSGKEYGIWSVYTVKSAEMHIHFRKAGMKPVFLENLTPKGLESLEVEVLYTETDANFCQNKNAWKVKARFQNHVDRDSIVDIIEKDRLHRVIGDLTPKSWSFDEFRLDPRKFYIAKPVGVGASSNAGISVFSTQKEFEVAKKKITADPRWRGIVCEYVHRPILYQGKKFHVRFYIIVRTWAKTVCFSRGKIFPAKMPYEEYTTQLEINTTHMDDNPLLVFPEDLPSSGVEAHEIKKVVYHVLLQTCERIDSTVKPKPYPRVEHAWHVLAADLMLYRSSEGDIKATILEINDKPAFDNNEKNLGMYLDKIGIAYSNWEYEVTVGDLLRRGSSF